jgi:hypothetical protein
MEEMKKYHLRNFRAICTIVIVFILSGCNSNRIKTSSIMDYFRSPEKRVFNLYTNYINDISTPYFPLASFQSNPDLFKQPDYAKKLQSDNNLQFFPATLWQVYSLNRKSKWKDIADNYYRLLQEEGVFGKSVNGELIQNTFLTPFLITGDQKYNSALLKVLADYISEAEDKGELGCTDKDGDIGIEKLLENQLLLFATNETGDPVYRELALNNSEQIFNSYFQNNQSKDFYNGLVNWNTIPDITEMQELTSQDFYNLTYCFYGFTAIGNEMGIKKYHSISEKLADVYINIFKDIDNTSTKNPNGLIVNKVDMVSQALICLTLYNLNDSSENKYKETSEKIFNNILDSLNNAQNQQADQQSFRLYYYLFEYLKQKQ